MKVVIQLAIAVEVEKRWRSKGYNSNVRGAGSSRATFYRMEKMQKDTETAARNHSQPLHNYFEGIMTDDGNKSDDDDDNDGEDDERNLYQILFDDQIESGNSKSLLLA